MTTLPECVYGDGCLLKLIDDNHDATFSHKRVPDVLLKCASDPNCEIYRSLRTFIKSGNEMTDEMKGAQIHVSARYHTPIYDRMRDTNSATGQPVDPYDTRDKIDNNEIIVSPKRTAKASKRNTKHASKSPSSSSERDQSPPRTPSVERAEFRDEVSSSAPKAVITPLIFLPKRNYDFRETRSNEDATPNTATTESTGRSSVRTTPKSAPSRDNTRYQPSMSEGNKRVSFSQQSEIDNLKTDVKYLFSEIKNIKDELENSRRCVDELRDLIIRINLTDPY